MPSFVLRSNGPAFVFFPMRRDATHFSCEGRVGPCLLLSAKGEPSPFAVSKVTAIKGNRAIVLSREMQGLRPFLCLLKEGPSDCSFRAALSKVRGKKGWTFVLSREKESRPFVCLVREGVPFDVSSKGKGRPFVLRKEREGPSLPVCV